MDLKSKIRDIVDFPEKGIIFRDITTLLKDNEAMPYAVDEITKCLNPDDFDIILGPESRGFIFGMPVAYNLKKGFVPVRKKGKLPASVRSFPFFLTGKKENFLHLQEVKNILLNMVQLQ